jgi:hypothetical protein
MTMLFLGSASPAFTSASGGAAADPPVPAADAWRQPLRLYDQFFGLADDPGADRQAAVGALRQRVEAARAPGLPGPQSFQLRFMIALVPDPLDSQLPAAFDQAIDAIGQSFGHSSPRRGPAWLPDRSWIPWNDPPTVASKRYRGVPGLLLFRRILWHLPQAGRPCELMGVFLVGETPKTGIEPAAFHEALQLIADLSPDRRLPVPVRILGPTYSGSALSLRAALLDWERLHPPPPTAASPAAPAIQAGSARPAPATPGRAVAGPSCQEAAPVCRFLIVSGTARAPCLEGLLRLRDGEGIRFYRAVLPLDVLLRTALVELHRRMGWDLSKVVLVSELDTAFGQSVAAERSVSQCDPEPLPPGVGVVRFPSHLAAIRTAGEAAGGAAPSSDSGTAGTAGSPPVPAAAAPAAAPAAVPANTTPSWTRLPLTLGDQPPGVDLVPDFSPLTAPANDLTIGSLIAAINRYDVRYVGIVATDVRDTLFLANRIRGLAANVNLFSVEGELLYTHPDVHTALFGTTLISSSPLFTSIATWQRPAGRSSPPWQFASTFQNGIYQAAVELLSPCALASAVADDAGPVWISVVGNGAVWPLGGIDSARAGGAAGAGGAGSAGSAGGDRGTSRRQRPEALEEAILSFDRLLRAEEGIDAPGSAATPDLRAAATPSPKGDMELLLFGALLCLGAWWLHKAALLPAPRGGEEAEAGTRRLLVAGLAALALPAAALLVLCALAQWGWRRSEVSLAGWTAARSLSFAGLVVEYGFILAAIVCAAAMRRRRDDGPRPAQLSRPTRPWRRWAVAATAVLLAGAALVAVLGLSVAYLWMPWSAGFDLRLRALGSGLSPLVSLMWLVAALYVWTLTELQRRRLTAWQEIDWPLAEAVAPAFRGCDRLLAAIRWLLQRTVPRGPGHLLLLAAPAVAVIALGGWEMQPVAETPAFGRLMLALWTVPAVLAGISFYRFVAVWRHLRRLLQRIASTGFAARLGQLAPELSWKPMQAFTWPIPPFQTLILSHRRLERLLHEDRMALGRDETAQLERAVERALALAFEADAGGRRAEEILHRAEVQRFICQASEGLDPVRSDPAVMDFFAIRIAAYLRYVFAQLRSALLSGLVPAFLLLLAVSAYTFEPKGPISLGLLAALLAAIAITISVFVGMSRDTVLSLVAGTTPGEVTFDSHFVMSILKFGAVPLAGLVATQVPAAGQLVNTWLRPLLRLVGAE